MRKTVLALCLLCLALLLGCGADPRADLTGTWEGSMTLEDEGEPVTVDLVLELKDSDGLLSGNCSCSGDLCNRRVNTDTAIQHNSGTVSVDGVSQKDGTITLLAVLPGGVVQLDGVVLEDDIEGTCLYHSAEHSWHVTRTE